MTNGQMILQDWTVTRTWNVKAESATAALEKAKPGKNAASHVEVGRTTYPFDPDWCIAPGHIVRDWCEENNVKQSKLALRAGISQKHLSQIVTGNVTFSPGMCVKLANAMGIRADFLYRLQADWIIGRALGKTETK